LKPTVSENVDHTKDQPVLGPHCDVTSVSVSRDRSFGRSDCQEFVHLPDASDFVTCSVDGKDKDKDDRKEYGSVGAVFAKKLGCFGHLGKNGDTLVTEQGGSHTTDDNIDGHTDRDQEASGNRIHSR